MDALFATESTELTPAALSSLEECSEESIVAPGHIQPHGVLLTLQEPNLKILQISENVESFFGISAKALLGQPLQRLFSRTQVKRMVDCLAHDQLEVCNPFELKTRRGHGSADSQRNVQTFKSTLHRTPKALILELEPLLTPQNKQSLQFYYRLQSAILNLRSATTLSDLAQTIAREVKAITGFDRVMIYRFESDEHGIVIAEEKASHLKSFLGLHYPAFDIPAPARKLFCHNWVRQIPDVNYTPVRLLSNDAAAAEPPLDLSACVLRGVFPCHIEYLQNMGVAGTFTISLIDDKRLWGLIACHHYSPRLLDYETRKTCEFLGQFASVELMHQYDRALDHYQNQVKALQDKLQQAFWREPNFIQQVLTRNANELLDLVHANGMAIALDEDISLIGKTPSLEEVQSLLNWLPRLRQPEIYLTNCLVRTYPPARAFKDAASGMLAISVVLHQKSYHLLWFRPEQIQTVSWAGNPQDAITIDELGKLHLCPRKSFELWKETVQETSLPWETAEVEAARMMRNTLMLAVLEFSQAALEQAAERAAIASRAKSQFLAKMSHELRTPLNAILGFTQIMNRSPNIPAEFQEHLGIVNRSGEHLLTLINDVLEMSKIEAGQLVLTECCFDLFRLIRSIEEMFALKASEKGLSLNIEHSATIPHYVCGDEAKLRQILINLLSNAIKFTQEGKVTLRVSAVSRCAVSRCMDARKQATLPAASQSALQSVSQSASQSASTGIPTHSKKTITLQLEVEDTGCGIAAFDLESIFEAFMQTDRGRHIQGTGLGLSISRQFARLMEGDITVRSTPGQGSTFTCQVVLYLPESIDFVEPEVNHRVVALESDQPTYRILVAEDVPENRQLMVTLLSSVGFEVKAVENGADAIVQWQAWQPHLIFMDIQMPVMDGYEATQQIRSQEAANHRQPTPIIALTAYAFEDDRTASLKAGCNEHLAKPFTETIVFNVIARYLDVHYRYRDESPKTFFSAQKSLIPQDLKIMPTTWITQVHEASLDLNDGKLRELIAQIPTSEQQLIDTMISLVNNFQLETIAALTQP